MPRTKTSLPAVDVSHLQEWRKHVGLGTWEQLDAVNCTEAVALLSRCLEADVLHQSKGIEVRMFLFFELCRSVHVQIFAGEPGAEHLEDIVFPWLCVYHLCLLCINVLDIADSWVNSDFRSWIPSEPNDLAFFVQMCKSVQRHIKPLSLRLDSVSLELKDSQKIRFRSSLCSLTVLGLYLTDALNRDPKYNFESNNGKSAWQILDSLYIEVFKQRLNTNQRVFHERRDTWTSTVDFLKTMSGRCQNLELYKGVKRFVLNQDSRPKLTRPKRTKAIVEPAECVPSNIPLAAQAPPESTCKRVPQRSRFIDDEASCDSPNTPVHNSQSEGSSLDGFIVQDTQENQVIAMQVNNLKDISRSLIQPLRLLQEATSATELDPDFVGILLRLYNHLNLSKQPRIENSRRRQLDSDEDQQDSQHHRKRPDRH